MLEVVVDEWRQIAEATPILRHPVVWVGFYDDDGRSLGAVHSPSVSRVSELVLFLASPFATSADVTDAWIIWDRTATLSVVHLHVPAPQRVRSWHWMVPKQLDDDGLYDFGVGTQCPAPDVLAPSVDSLIEHRLFGYARTGTFHEAFAVAVQHAKDIR